MSATTETNNTNEAPVKNDAEQAAAAGKAPASDKPAVAEGDATAAAAAAATPAAGEAAQGAGAPPGGNASLYVGDLQDDVTEATLYEVFNAIGHVTSIRVCRHAVTRRSLGYAYINYYNVADAERALEALNYTEIKGKAIRIMWSHRDPSVRKSGVGNVFVKNLEPSIDHRVLFDTFSQFGNILSCKVVLDENAESRGHGFVHYETAEAAASAIEKVNGKLLAGKKIFVAHFQPRKDRLNTGEFTNIYFSSNSSQSTEEIDEKVLEDAFKKHGEIGSYVLQKDADGKSKGFGFVSFKTPASAAACVAEMNGMMIGGKSLYVARHQKKQDREAELRMKYEQLRSERASRYQGVNLYVKNLDDFIDDEKLRAAFKEYGEITSALVMRDDKGASKGFAFVCFANPEDATRALSDMNGKMLGAKPIYVALAQRKDVRRQQLEAQHHQRNMRGPGMPGQMMTGPGGMYGPGAMGFYGQQQGTGGARGGFAFAGAQQMPGQMLGGRGGPGGRGGMQMGPQGAMWPAQGAMMGAGMPGARGGYQGQGGMNMPGYVNMPNQGRGRQRQQGGQGGQGGSQQGGAGGAGGAQQGSQQGGRAGKGSGGPGANQGGERQNVKYNRNARNRVDMQAQAQQAQFQAMTPQQQAQFHAQQQQMMQQHMMQQQQQQLMGGQPMSPQMMQQMLHQQQMQMQQAQANAAQMGGAGGAPQAQDPMQGLSQASPEVQKQMLGERLYPLIAALEPEQAPKITGMLLDIDASEILLLIESPEALAAKVKEALVVLKAHESETAKDAVAAVPEATKA